MRRIKQIMGILLSWLLLLGIFQFMPVNIDGGTSLAAAVLSSDNSLSSLSLSQGTLSPAFQYNVVNYTATVGADVTSVEVSAKTSNDTATIESVSGNTNLQAGENLISIVVKAQDGTPATYKIVVTREAGGTTAAGEPADTTAAEPQEGDADQEGITLNGHPFDLASEIPEENVPADFTKTTIDYQGQQVEALTFDKSQLTLVYLTTPSTEVRNTFAVYGGAGEALYPFRKIQFDETNYLIVLNPPEETGLSQEYTKTTQTVGDFENVTAYVKAEDSQAAVGAGSASDSAGFSLVYGVSSYGNKGWYQYDAMESTFQRYIPVQIAEEPVVEEPPQEEVAQPDEEMLSLQKAYTDMEAQYNKQKDSYRKVTAVLIFIIAVMIVVVVNLLLRGKRMEEDELEDELNYDELTEKVRAQVKSVRKLRREEDGQRLESEESDSELWEDDTIPKEILNQQTKVIPDIGADAELQKGSSVKNTTEPQKGSLLKNAVKPQKGSLLENAVKPQKDSPVKDVEKPDTKQEPESEPDEDFEVIDLEDL